MSENPPQEFKPVNPNQEEAVDLPQEMGNQPTKSGFDLPFDPVRIFMATQRWWYLPPIAGILFGMAAFIFAKGHFKIEYSDELMLIPNEIPTNLRANEFGESYKPQEIKSPTFLSMMKSRNVLASTVRHPSLKDHVSIGDLQRNLSLDHDRKTGIFKANYKTFGGKKEVTAVLTAYGKEVENLSRRIQTEEAQDVVQFLDRQLSKANSELSMKKSAIQVFLTTHNYLDANLEMEADLRTRNDVTLKLKTAEVDLATIDFSITNYLDILRDHHPLFDKLKKAREKHSTLLLQYTAENPLVIAQAETVQFIETEVEESLLNEDPKEIPEFSRDTFTDTVFLNLVKAQANKNKLSAEIASYNQFLNKIEENMSRMPKLAQEYIKLKDDEKRLQILVDLLGARKREAEMFIEEVIPAYKAYDKSVYESVKSSNPGKMFMAVVFFGMAFGSGMVFLIIVVLELLNDRIKTIGDLKRLTQLQVLGGLTEFNEEPKDTGKWSLAMWKKIENLIGNKSRHSEIVSLVSLHRGEGKTTWIGYLAKASYMNGGRVLAFVNSVPSEGEWDTVTMDRFLEHPTIACPKLDDPTAIPKPVAVLQPAGWVWTRRNHILWNRAVKMIEKLSPFTAFVEINDPTNDDNMLFISKSSNVFWLSQSGEARFGEISSILKLLKSMSTQLRGAFINKLPKNIEQLPMATRTLSWILMGCLAFSIWSSTPSTYAQSARVDTKTAPAEYLFGPGDVLDISIYANPGTIRKGLVVAPDGRINYLEASNILAAGKSVKQLRKELTKKLSNFYQPSNVIIIPKRFLSKRYTVMGAVQDPGTYLLDRPITLLEAVARARGLKVGLFDRKNVELADLNRAFITRKGQKLPIDFRALFNGRDPDMNIQLEHGDYIFFPSTSLNEVYLIGEVVGKGNIAMTEGLTVTQLISRQGGFLPNAYLSKVVVIRGSLADPKVHTVNVKEILKGKQLDFRLEVGDYVYVPDKPWTEIELVVESAARAFIGASASTLASERIPALINK